MRRGAAQRGGKRSALDNDLDVFLSPLEQLLQLILEIQSSIYRAAIAIAASVVASLIILEGHSHDAKIKRCV